MRTIDVIKKEQDQALLELGFHVARVEQAKARVFILAKEAEDFSARAVIPTEGSGAAGDLHQGPRQAGADGKALGDGVPRDAGQDLSC